MVADKQAEILKQLQQGAGLEADDGLESAGDRPCTIYALGAAGSGGFLGAMYGFGESPVRVSGRSRQASAQRRPLADFYRYKNCDAQRSRPPQSGARRGFELGKGELTSFLTKQRCTELNLGLTASLSRLLSLQAFAVFGGVYALASCIVQRLRQKEDGMNGMPTYCFILPSTQKAHLPSFCT